MSAPAARREAVGVAMERHGLSERHACRLVGLNRGAPVKPARSKQCKSAASKVQQTTMAPSRAP